MQCTVTDWNPELPADLTGSIVGTAVTGPDRPRFHVVDHQGSIAHLEVPARFTPIPCKPSRAAREQLIHIGWSSQYAKAQGYWLVRKPSAGPPVATPLVTPQTATVTEGGCIARTPGRLFYLILARQPGHLVARLLNQHDAATEPVKYQHAWEQGWTLAPIHTADACHCQGRTLGCTACRGTGVVVKNRIGLWGPLRPDDRMFDTFPALVTRSPRKDPIPASTADRYAQSDHMYTRRRGV